MAFLVVLGLPTAWLALRALGTRAPEAAAIFAVLSVAAVLGFTKAGTERIWQFLGPYVCLAAAPALAARPRWVAPVAAALAVQALATELLFGSPW